MRHAIVQGLADRLTGLRGTVTEFLEDLVGEPVFADKIEQSPTAAAQRNPLGVQVGHLLLRRVAVLRGRQSGRAFVYADTLLAPDRMPSTASRQLLESDDPIGRVLVEHDLTVVRAEVTSVASSRQSAPPTEFLHARQYSIEIYGQPAVHVAEWFLPDLGDFLVRPETPGASRQPELGGGTRRRSGAANSRNVPGSGRTADGGQERRPPPGGDGREDRYRG